MWWDIIVWNLNKNIGLILRLSDSFASTRIAFICWYWYSQNILNLTQLQRNLFLYIYISGIILRLTNQIVFSICLAWFLILTDCWVIQSHPLFGVTICPKQLKILGLLCSLCNVIGDLGFLNYNQIYLLGINKKCSPPFNIYQSPTIPFSGWGSL